MRKPLLAAGALLVAACPANAKTAPVPFNASVGDYCTIVVMNEGMMMASADHRTLSSTLPGGKPGEAEVTTTGPGFGVYLGYTNIVETPPGFETGLTRIDKSYILRGATEGEVELGRTRTELHPGTTRVLVNVAFVRLDGPPFVEGPYRAEAYLTCE